ncbi:MAG: response regulator [Cyclobacteriaceae bacterium]
MSKEGNILIVEDSLITTIHLEKLVTNAGHHVLSKTDFAEQVALICDDQMPDLILMDIMLNGEMTGVDAAELLRQSTVNVPIIFISALSDHNTQTRIENISKSTLIPKPFDQTQLISTINSFLN